MLPDSPVVVIENAPCSSLLLHGGYYNPDAGEDGALSRDDKLSGNALWILCSVVKEFYGFDDAQLIAYLEPAIVAPACSTLQ